jgi:hypothetical protein
MMSSSPLHCRRICTGRVSVLEEHLSTGISQSLGVEVSKVGLVQVLPDTYYCQAKDLGWSEDP